MMTELEMFEQLKRFDTPSITNVVATYPKDRELCLGLYDPWGSNWYTDQSLKCMYPELGRKIGVAVTVVYGLPAPGGNDRLTMDDLLRAIANVKMPVVVLIKQDLPEHIKNKSGLAGGNMLSAFKAVGAVGVISDGPSRDIDEVRPKGIQYMLTGVTPGHGEYSIKAINVPVTICGMDVSPGEIIHLDENGAVKFPREYLGAIIERAEKLMEAEARMQAAIGKTSDVEEVIRLMKAAGKREEK
jgi:regulator of RNase E activity RraA